MAQKYSNSFAAKSSTLVSTILHKLQASEVKKCVKPMILQILVKISTVIIYRTVFLSSLMSQSEKQMWICPRTPDLLSFLSADVCPH